jgi:speckle-type POZ protein
MWDIFVDWATPQADVPDANVTFLRPVRLTYQPLANSTFLSEQISHQQPASSSFSLRTNQHQPPAISQTNRLLVGGEELSLSAHSSVLAARSPVFEAELNSAMIVAGECIRVDDMLPNVFDSLLDFAYTGSLPEMTGAEESVMPEHLLVAADRFGMQDLKVICEEQLLCTDTNEDTIAKMLKLAVRHNCSLLRNACIQFLEDPPVLQAVMANGDEDLLKLVAETCPAHLKELWVCDEDDCMKEELAMYL